jgi:DNA (cytosine-5)-methyltransferase 1
MEANVDTTKTITHLSLCSGYGGIDLGLKRVLPALRTIAYVEIEAFACANLVAKMEANELDAAPVWTNLKTCDWEIFRDRVDILSGGYPCQPFSAAGKRAGKEDPRHLWPFLQRAIGVIRPRFCFFENVEGHLTLGFKDVCHDLGELGYELTAGLFSAAECGAPHQRKRVFILARLAESTRIRIQGCGAGGKQVARPYAEEALPLCACETGGGRWPARPGEPQHEWEEPRVVGDSKGGQSGQQKTGDGRESAGGTSSTELAATGSNRDGCSRAKAEPNKDEPQDGVFEPHGKHENRQAGPLMGRATPGAASGLDATANRVDRLRLLGNGVVPATCEVAFRTLYNELHARSTNAPLSEHETKEKNKKKRKANERQAE